MKLHIIASGSSGNCICMEHGKNCIFIDAGIPVVRVKNALKNIPLNKEISLFITHEHSDHICGLIPFVNLYSPKIYTSEMTADILIKKGINENKLFILDHDVAYDFKEFSVKPFKLMHDAADPMGFKFDIDGKTISIATDFGIVSDYILKSIENSELMILESNYEDELLKKSKYPEILKKRIASHKGHLSNKDAFRIVGEISAGRLKKCFLAHVSENSNDYNLLEQYAGACQKDYLVETKVIHQKEYINFNF